MSDDNDRYEAMEATEMADDRNAEREARIVALEASLTEACDIARSCIAELRKAAIGQAPAIDPAHVEVLRGMLGTAGYEMRAFESAGQSKNAHEKRRQVDALHAVIVAIGGAP